MPDIADENEPVELENADYQEALEEGVVDDSLLDGSTSKEFTITSYGVDYTIDTLITRLEKKTFRIPDFQRKYVWTQRHASRFIESLLLGLPVPGIFLYKEPDTNRQLVIDGQQRLKTLEAFCRLKIFSERKFRLIGVREPWVNKTYDELSPAEQLKIDDSVIHATIFQQDKPTDSLDSIFFVFERINSGGIRLSAQEIRACISSGDFLKKVSSLNAYNNWRTIYGSTPSKRGKDEELIVRFFALLDKGSKYKRPMSKFLTDYSASANKKTDDELAQMGKIFELTIDVVLSAIGTKAFRPSRNFNTAVYDGVMVGLARRLSVGSRPSDTLVSNAYDTLVVKNEFVAAYERATADEESVRIRLMEATAAFEKI